MLFIAIFICLAIFFMSQQYFNRRREKRENEMREKRERQFEELLNLTKKRDGETKA